jgi:DNA adenine methylase
VLQSQQLVQYNLSRAKPFLKWAGGKSRLLEEIEQFLPPADIRQRYHEPFLGGGAMFFHLNPEHAWLSDKVRDLITTYRTVRDRVDELIDTLRDYEGLHGKEGKSFYEQVRAQKPTDLTPVKKAARFVYLNKTCYNGIYRVNNEGEFNVPMGRYERPRILDEPTLRTASAALKSTSIQPFDYAKALSSVKRGDFVYLDPPYWGRYTSYHQDGFGPERQGELARLCRKLSSRGAYLMMNNGADEEITKLYDGFRIINLRSRVFLSGKLKGRRIVGEFLILNYDSDRFELVKSASRA